jgi:hypothetical protein
MQYSIVGNPDRTHRVEIRIDFGRKDPDPENKNGPQKWKNLSFELLNAFVIA